MTREFIHLGRLNGFCRENSFISKDYDYIKDRGLLGPYNLREMMKIHWLLKEVKVSVELSRETDDFWESTSIGNDLAPNVVSDKNCYIESKKAIMAGNLLLEPYKRINPIITLNDGIQDFFNSTEIWIDEKTIPIDDLSLQTKSLYFLTYNFSVKGAGINVFTKTESNAGNGAPLEIPFLKRTMELLIKYDSADEKTKHSVKVEMTGEYYDNGDFI